VLSRLPTFTDPRLLVGSGTFDDAGVLRLTDELALVQSVDFFTPVVDDPFDFGRIAAANALSDLYAMGADPLCAMAVCAFPHGSLPLDALRRTLAGGLETLRATGVLPMGGHTVKGPEFTYGLAVTGTVHPERILTNAGAREGDALFLTKPLGTGVLATALKRGALGEAETRALVDSMVSTNAAAASACRAVETHALTDVTGYGLLGHGLEMAEASGVALEIEAAALPLLPGAREAATSAVPGGLKANLAWVESRATFDAALDEGTRNLLVDPQTSGGLLAAIAPEDASAFAAACVARGAAAVRVGRITAGRAGTARVIA
jgi:selenide,water dikinase